MPLPAGFVERMSGWLGQEAEAFFAALAQPALSGLRVNTLKTSVTRLLELTGWSMTPTPWCPTGFVLTDDNQPGKHPYHAAGLYYLQEPSAMAVAEVLAPQPGDRVIDLAAAPGGKSTHLVTLMADAGLLVANEVEPGRTRALAENLERWGARHAIITNSEVSRLGEQWGAVFDRVLLDAPCSGEGMFRKSQTAVDQWSQGLIDGCALRQRRLLDSAAQLVRPGGWLVYSTCAFAPEENEEVIADFVARHPGFSLRPMTLPGLLPGRPDWVSTTLSDPSLALTARLWPHRASGEGHFVALLQRTGGTAGRVRPARGVDTTRAQRRLWRTFVDETLGADPLADVILTTVGPHLYAVPEQALVLDGLKVVRSGLWLGTLHRDRFEPSHSLALALRPTDVNLARTNTLDLAPSDERLARYMQGHPLAEPGEAGWVLLTTSGFPLGWGRRSQGVVKNHYPKGLRQP